MARSTQHPALQVIVVMWLLGTRQPCPQPPWGRPTRGSTHVLGQTSWSQRDPFIHLACLRQAGSRQRGQQVLAAPSALLAPHSTRVARRGPALESCLFNPELVPDLSSRGWSPCLPLVLMAQRSPNRPQCCTPKALHTPHGGPIRPGQAASCRGSVYPWGPARP